MSSPFESGLISSLVANTLLAHSLEREDMRLNMEQVTLDHPQVRVSVVSGMLFFGVDDEVRFFIDEAFKVVTGSFKNYEDGTVKMACFRFDDGPGREARALRIGCMVGRILLEDPEKRARGLTVLQQEFVEMC